MAEISGLRITVTASAGDLFSGFAAGEMRFSYYGRSVIPPDSVIRLTISRGSIYHRYPPYRVTSVKRKGARLDIIACDRLHELGRTVDASGYDEHGVIDTALLASAMAHDCGFSGVGNVPRMSLSYSDVYDKTCREVLMQMSVIGCGVWTCSGDDELVFIPYGTASFQIVRGEHSDTPFYIHSTKGPIRGLCAKNTETHREWLKGDTSASVNCVSIRGRMMTEQAAQNILTLLAGKYIRSFYADHIPSEEFPNVAVCGVAGIWNGDDLYLSRKTTVHYGNVIYMDMEYPDKCGDDSAAAGYGTGQGLSYQTEYGGAVMDGLGLGILSETPTDDIRTRDKFYFRKAKSAVSRFDGALMDNVMPRRIINVSETEKRIEYDGIAYRLTYTKTAQGKENIVLEEIADDE
ncbi:MAG: hypothetical protein K6G68_11955 [Oscillospiraceae bacterium]|nr:hypothetical protein [Oscillospiraceae bacterium]